MLRLVHGELRKTKRTWLRRLVVLGPLSMLLLTLPIKLLMPYLEFSWELHLYQGYNWWPVLFIPIGTALLATLAAAMERKNRFLPMRLSPLAPGKIWIAKVAALSLLSLATFLILILFVLFSGLLVAQGDIPWKKIIIGGLVMWWASLPLIPLQLGIASGTHPALSLGAGFGGLLAGVLAAPKQYWVLIPWSWPIRLMSPIIGVHPNGLPLEVGDPLWDPSVIGIGLALSLASYLTFTLVSGLWFNRKED